MRAEVEAIPESDWRPHPQGNPGNSALPLISLGGNPLDDGVAGTMLPTPHLEKCEYLRQVLASFETVFGRSRLMRLEGKSEATLHVDTQLLLGRPGAHPRPDPDQPGDRVHLQRALAAHGLGRGLDLRRLATPQRAQPDRRPAHPPGRRHGRLGGLLGAGLSRRAPVLGQRLRAPGGARDRPPPRRGGQPRDRAGQLPGGDEPVGAAVPVPNRARRPRGQWRPGGATGLRRRGQRLQARAGESPGRATARVPRAGRCSTACASSSTSGSPHSRDAWR